MAISRSFVKLPEIIFQMAQVSSLATWKVVPPVDS